jgi:NAD-dependent dihydropyrimidine dehydrogenase PreA subunit
LEYEMQLANKSQILEKKKQVKQKSRKRGLLQAFSKSTMLVLFCLSIGALFVEVQMGPFGAGLSLADPLQPQMARKLMHQLIWTAVGFVPVFVLLFGFGQWRSICPLASLSQLASKFRRDTKMRPIPAKLRLAGQWAPTLGLAIVVYLRLLGMNALPMALGAWLLGMASAAALYGALWGGRTWCHYVCPMGVVEHLFEQASGREGKQDNLSMCSPCVQCKLNCPDISLEKSTQLQNMRSFFYSYPGLVVGFFVWPYLHRGNLAGWLRSDWYFEPVHLTDPGFFFWSACPKGLAIAISLSSAALLSYSFFAFMEKVAPSSKKHSTHRWTQQVAIRTGAYLFSFGVLAPLGTLLVSTLVR